MAEIKLGKTPKTFKPFPVKFVTPEGEEAQILVTFKYRTRTQFGALMNEMYQDAGQAPAADGTLDFEALHEKLGRRTAAHLVKAIEGWDLADHKPNQETFEQLSDEMPAAVVALMSAYSGACTEGRLGN